MQDVDVEILFTMAEKSYLSARKEKDPSVSAEEFLRCSIMAEMYVALGGRRNVHVYMNFALNALGKIREALNSCRAGLRIDPENQYLLTNKRLYERYLGSDGEDFLQEKVLN